MFMTIQRISSSPTVSDTRRKPNSPEGKGNTISSSMSLKSGKVIIFLTEINSKGNLIIYLTGYSFNLQGTQHGFGSRPNLNLPEIKAAFEGAFEQTIEWFRKTLVN